MIKRNHEEGRRLPGIQHHSIEQFGLARIRGPVWKFQEMNFYAILGIYGCGSTATARRGTQIVGNSTPFNVFRQNKKARRNMDVADCRGQTLMVS